MKRQLLSAALLSLSVLNLTTTTAKANLIKDIEPNNDQARSTIKIDKQISEHVQGNVSRNDRRDIYALRLNSASIKSFDINMDLSGVIFNLFEDVNNNRRIDTADKILTNYKNIPVGKNPFLLRFADIIKTPSPGKYFAQINPKSYVRDVGITIHSAKALSRFDTKIPFTNKHRADFFGQVDFGGRSTPKKTNKVNDNDSPTFNGKALVNRVIGAAYMDFRLQLMDADADFDDEANISPTSSKHAKILYHIPTGTIFDSKGSRLGRRGQKITLQGNNGKRASITFSVNHTEVNR